MKFKFRNFAFSHTECEGVIDGVPFEVCALCAAVEGKERFIFKNDFEG